MTASDTTPWYTLSAQEAVRLLGSDADTGLSRAAAIRERERHGPNELPREPQASAVQIVALIWADPMNLMLTAVAGVAFGFGQPETGLLVAALVLLNVFMGASQELKARASVAALDSLQVPQARVLRDGQRRSTPSTSCPVTCSCSNPVTLHPPTAAFCSPRPWRWSKVV